MLQSLAWKPTLSGKDVEVQSVDCPYDGNYTVKRYTIRHRLFAGQWTPWITREQVSRRNAVAILLYDPKRDEIVFVEQFRTGLLNQHKHQSPWLLEIVAGLIDETDQTPEQTAIREVQEETGFFVKHLQFITCYYNSPGGFTERTYVYCALVAADKAGGTYGVREEHEDIRVQVLPFNKVNTFMAQGWLTSASTMIALQWLVAKREHLRVL